MTRPTTPLGWVLRAVILLGPLTALLATLGAGHRPPPALVLLVAGLSALWTFLPESSAGIVVLALVVAWWGVALRGGLDPWALVAAAALLAAHLAALLASYGPADVTPDRSLQLLWARRALLVLLAAPALLAALAGLGEPSWPRLLWVSGLVAAAGLVVAAGLALPARRPS